MLLQPLLWIAIEGVLSPPSTVYGNLLCLIVGDDRCIEIRLKGLIERAQGTPNARTWMREVE